MSEAFDVPVGTPHPYSVGKPFLAEHQTGIRDWEWWFWQAQMVMDDLLECRELIMRVRMGESIL